MIHAEFFPSAVSFFTANGAQSFLLFKHIGVVVKTNAVVSEKIIISSPLWI
jgi:hypothetical protein